MVELNELIALVLVTIAALATIAVRAHSANTPRTREWWGRFLRLLVLLIVAQVATNLEELYPGESPGDLLNVIEHLAMAAAAAWAVAMSLRGLSESYALRQRNGQVNGSDGEGGPQS